MKAGFKAGSKVSRDRNNSLASSVLTDRPSQSLSSFYGCRKKLASNWTSHFFFPHVNFIPIAEEVLSSRTTSKFTSF